MGQNCFNCMKQASVMTKDGQKKSCLHCAIGQYFCVEWVVRDKEMLQQQIKEELAFISAMQIVVSSHISKLEAIQEKIAPSDASKDVICYIRGINECYDSHRKIIIQQLKSLLHTYSVAQTSFSKHETINLEKELYSILHPLKQYDLFPLLPSQDSISPILKKQSFTEHVRMCEALQKITNEKVLAEFSNSNKRLNTAFLQNGKLITCFSSKVLYKANFYSPYTVRGSFPITRTLLINREKLLIADQLASCIIYVNIRPAIMIKISERKVCCASYSCFTSPNPNLVYCVSSSFRNKYNEKYTFHNNKWIRIPGLRFILTAITACSVNGRYVYVFGNQNTANKCVTERLDSCDEEVGREVIEMQCMQNPAVLSAMQISDAEILQFGSQHTFKYNFITNSAELKKARFCIGTTDLQVRRGTIYIPISNGCDTYSIIDWLSSHLDSLPIQLED